MVNVLQGPSPTILHANPKLVVSVTRKTQLSLHLDREAQSIADEATLLPKSQPVIAAKVGHNVLVSTFLHHGDLLLNAR